MPKTQHTIKKLILSAKYLPQSHPPNCSCIDIQEIYNQSIINIFDTLKSPVPSNSSPIFCSDSECMNHQCNVSQNERTSSSIALTRSFFMRSQASTFHLQWKERGASNMAAGSNVSTSLDTCCCDNSLKPDLSFTVFLSSLRSP